MPSNPLGQATGPAPSVNPVPPARSLIERVKEAVGSPKAPGALLAAGSLLWKFIADLSNIDFILSINDSRLAILLELLLSWGWLVIALAAILWALLEPS